MLESTETSKSNVSEVMIFHPMGFTDILDGVFSLYRRHFRLYFGIATVYLFGNLVSYALQDFPVLIPQRLLRLVIEMSFSFIFILVSCGAAVITSATLYLGNRVTSLSALRLGFQQWFPILKGTFVWILVAGGLTITIIGSPFGIYFAVRWGFYIHTMLLEKLSVRDALRRSSELIHSMWWRVGGTLLAIIFIDAVIHATVEISFGYILILTGIAGELNIVDIIRWATMGDPVFGTDDLILYTITTGFHLVISMFLFPIWHIGSTLLYFNQRIRQEGFDIELRVRILQTLDGEHKV